MDEFTLKLPKVELHAHLNGSLSLETLRKLNADNYKLHNLKELKDFFSLFTEIYSTIDTREKTSIAASSTIQEFKDDGVIYLELRSTPRSSLKMTMEEYVLGLLESEFTGIRVNWILSMDRRFSLERNSNILDLAIKYRKRGIVGIDICGDPYQGNLKDMVQLILKAKENNLYTTIHLGEIQNTNEAAEILKLKPDRIGHGTFLQESNVKSLGIPLEICLTSNLACKVVSSLEKHHFQDFHMDDHPVILCTDDKGIFNSNLSQEYLLASKAFNLGEKDLFLLAFKAVDYIFDNELKKEELRIMFRKFEKEHF